MKVIDGGEFDSTLGTYSKSFSCALLLDYLSSRIEKIFSDVANPSEGLGSCENEKDMLRKAMKSMVIAVKVDGSSPADDTKEPM